MTILGVPISEVIIILSGTGLFIVFIICLFIQGAIEDKRFYKQTERDERRNKGEIV